MGQLGAHRGDRPCERVHEDEVTEPLRDEGDRIDHRRDEHQGLHEERQDLPNVAKLDVERGEERTQPGRGHPDEEEHRHGEQHAAQRRGNVVVDHQRDEDEAREEEVRDADERRRERSDQPREVDLGDDALIVDQAVARVRERRAEDVPVEQPDEREDRVVPVGRGDAGHLVEEEREDDHQEERLEDRPARADHRLLVADLEVAPGEEVEELAVGPELTGSACRGDSRDGDLHGRRLATWPYDTGSDHPPVDFLSRTAGRAAKNRSATADVSSSSAWTGDSRPGASWSLESTGRPFASSSSSTSRAPPRTASRRRCRYQPVSSSASSGLELVNRSCGNAPARKAPQSSNWSRPSTVTVEWARVERNRSRSGPGS